MPEITGVLSSAVDWLQFVEQLLFAHYSLTIAYDVGGTPDPAEIDRDNHGISIGTDEFVEPVKMKQV